jgi:hypothetical protein
MIVSIEDAFVRTYSDSGQRTAYVEWTDSKGHTGRTEGNPTNAHMKALLARATREGVTIRKECW